MTTLTQVITEIKQQHPQLGQRPDKAVEIIKAGKVRQLPGGSFYVEGSREHPYQVSFWPMVNQETGRVQDGGWHCTCPDAQRAPAIEFYGSVRPTCKHILAAGLTELANEPMSKPEYDALQLAWEMGFEPDDYGLEAVA